MPKIVAETLDAHRELREQSLLRAAVDVARDEGWPAVTLADVARRAGLSRTAVYSYFASAADLVADVLLDELMQVAQTLAEALETPGTPLRRIDAWLDAALAYVADGRHALVRSAAEVALPPTRRAEVMAWHRKVADPLVDHLAAAGVDRPRSTASYLWAMVEVSVRRIEGGADAAQEIAGLKTAVARLCATEVG